MAMRHCNSLIFCSMALWIVFTAVRPVATSNDTIGALFDCIVVLQHAHTTSTDKYEIEAYKKFGELFELGNNKTRLGIAFYAPKSVRANGRIENIDDWLILPQTDDLQAYKQKLDSFKTPAEWMGPGGKWEPVEQIRMIENVMGYFGRNGTIRRDYRALSIVYIVTESPGNAAYPNISFYVSQMISIGIHLYMFLPNRTNGDDNQSPLKMANAAVYIERNRVISSESVYSKKMPDEFIKKIKPVILLDLCRFYQVCHYKDEKREKCYVEARMIKENYRFVYRDVDCDEEVKALIKCTHEDCLKTCDKMWPWENEPPCNGTCGVKVDGTRQGNAPKYMEHCPPWKTCPPCSTTTSTTTTTTTPEPTTPTTSSAVISDHPGGADIPNGKSDAPGGGNLIGIIIGAIFACLLILVILLIVAIIVTKKKRKKRAQLKDALAKSAGLKKMLMVKKSGGLQKQYSGKEAGVGIAGKSAQAAVVADMSIMMPVHPKPTVDAGKKGKSGGKKGKSGGKEASSKSEAGKAKEGPKKEVAGKKGSSAKKQ